MKVFYVTLYLLFVLSLTAKAQDSVKVALVQAHLAWGDVMPICGILISVCVRVRDVT